MGIIIVVGIIGVVLYLAMKFVEGSLDAQNKIMLNQELKKRREDDIELKKRREDDIK